MVYNIKKKIDKLITKGIDIKKRLLPVIEESARICQIFGCFLNYRYGYCFAKDTFYFFLTVFSYIYDQTSSSSSLSVLKGLPFWIWDKEQHRQPAAATNGNCCFNHAVSLPEKDLVQHPMFDYEKLLYDSLMSIDGSFKDKYLWCLKSTGLGVTEFMLRIMAWLCTKDNQWRNCQMCIVTGPNIDLAIKLINRMKNIFETKLGLYFRNKETVLELNGCIIEAYPSNHLDSFRSLTNPKFIYLDEADMFRKGEQEDVRHVSERYIGKSDPYIVRIYSRGTRFIILPDRARTRGDMSVQTPQDGLHLRPQPHLYRRGDRASKTFTFI